MARPRVLTRVSARPPTTLMGVADPYGYGISVNPATGAPVDWHQWIDQYEYVSEIRWPWSIWLYDQMRTDSQLAALLTAVMYGVRQLRFILEPNGARPSLVKEISEDLNLQIKGKDDQPIGRMKRRFSHHKFVGQALLAVLYGHAYFEQQGDIVDEKWRLRKLFPIIPHSIQRINVSTDGSLQSIQQWANMKPVPNIGAIGEPIPVDRLTAFIFEQEGHSWVGRSMMRDCFKDYLVKDRLMRVEAINHERAGGVPYANAPQGATPDEIADLDAMMRQFRVGESAGGALPYGSELKIAKGSGSDIDKTIQRYNESMARRFLAQLINLAQGGQHVGSYALSENFEDSFLVGQRTIAQWYCDVVNEHIIEDIADWNYGADEELTPRLVWERTSEDSLGVEQLAQLVQRGIIIVDEELENAIRYKYQLPKRTGPRPEELMGPGLPRTQPVEAPPGTPPGTGIPQDAGGQSGAPSSGTPASKASFLARLLRKPDVMAADGPVLVTVPNVEILHAGIEYNLSTGATTFTPEDLRDAVMAANEDGSIPSPRLKLGHVDPRYNDIKEFDATPSFGKATNLRLSENGMAVYADFVGVPKWLGDIMPTAFPSRSVEGYWGVQSQMGKEWRFVLSACSLLGVQWPGVTVLEDLPQYYGAEIPEGVQFVDPELVTATGGDPTVKFKKDKSAASANLDDVRRAFYNEYMAENPDTYWWWIQAVYTDPNELVVEDDESGRLFKISFESDTEGKVSFGEAEPVRIEYVPDNRDAQKAAASHVAAVLAIGRECLASYPTREDSVLPANASGGAMDPKEVRKRLGLPEDASDEQVKEAIKELNAVYGEAAPEGGDEGTEGGEGGGDEGSGESEAVTPPAQQPVAAATVPPGMVMIDEKTLETLKVGASAGLAMKTKTEKQDRDALVSAAIGDGRIAPAAREHWLKSLETADRIGDKETRAALEGMPKGLIPLELRGAAPATASGEGAGAGVDDETINAWTDGLFPEVRERRQREAALAAGEPVNRNRIQADATYRR